MEIAPGQLVSHYRIERRIGMGGMGVVYEAEDTRLSRRVALKFLPPELTHDPHASNRLLREARAASSLEHPNICSVHSVEETQDGQLFICMSFYEGETLRERLARPLGVDESLEIAVAIAGGLERAHEAGITHRDIKPANIMLTRRGEVKILDFGLAKHVVDSTQLTSVGAVVGTVAYMSPEQLRGEPIDARTDIFSLGVVLYEMLAGVHPFAVGGTIATADAIQHLQPEPLSERRPDLPDGLDGVVSRALAKHREARHRTAGELRTALMAVKQGLSVAPTRTGVRASTPTAGRPFAMPPALPLLVFVAALALIYRLVIVPGDVGGTPAALAVLAFENQSGDPELDYLRAVIPNLLITNLEQSKAVRVVTWERMQDVLRGMGYGALDPADVDRALAFELCQREQLDALVVGSFSKAADVVVADVKVVDVATKELLASANSRGEGVGSLLAHQIDELSAAIVKSPSLRKAREGNEAPKVAAVTTHSMEAYRLYLEGVRYVNNFLQVPAVHALEKAVELDSTFAMAYLYLGRALAGLLNQESARQAVEQALHLSRHATPREALFIEAEHAASVTRNLDRAIEVYEELVRDYPTEKQGFQNLAVLYQSVGRMEDAVSACTRAIELAPTWPPPVNQAAYLYIILGDYERARGYLERYAVLLPEEPNPLDSFGDFYIVLGRLDDAARSFEAALELEAGWGHALVRLCQIAVMKEAYSEALTFIERHSTVLDLVAIRALSTAVVGRVNLWLGRQEEALAAARLQEARADSAGNRMIRAAAHELTALVLAERGDVRQAEVRLDACLRDRIEEAPHRRYLWEAERDCLRGFFAVEARDPGEAAAALEAGRRSLAKARSLEKDVVRYWLDLLEGEIALLRGPPEAAIAILAAIEPPDPYFVVSRAAAFYWLPIRRDGLARALRAAGQLDRTINEYQRLTTWSPDRPERFRIHPAYHYELALLYEERGSPELAIQELETFLAISKGSSRDVAEIADAAERLARLERSRR